MGKKSYKEDVEGYYREELKYCKKKIKVLKNKIELLQNRKNTEEYAITLNDLRIQKLVLEDIQKDLKELV
jgi:hypothetical protein